MIPPDPPSEEIQRRLAARRRTGDIDALWPDVPPDARRAAMGRVRRAVEAVLRDGRPSLCDDEEREVGALGVAGFLSGTGPLLGWWIGEGRVTASAAVATVMERHLEHGRRRTDRLREECVRIVRCLRAHDVEPIVLKGVHTASEYFPHPATRPLADIDLLVEPARIAAAERALEASGLVQARRTRFAARSEWRPAGARAVVRSLDYDHADNPWSVDLHRALDRWYFRGTHRDLGEGALRTRRTIDLDGERVRVLDQPWLTAFLALHAAYDLSSVRLVRLLELALVVRLDLARGLLAWCDLASLLERTDTARFAAPALVLAEEVAPGTVDAARLQELVRALTPRMRRALSIIRGAELGPLSRAERTLSIKLAHARGARELALGVSEVMLPSDDGLEVGLGRLWAQRAAALASHLGRRGTP